MSYYPAQVNQYRPGADSDPLDEIKKNLEDWRLYGAAYTPAEQAKKSKELHDLRANNAQTVASRAVDNLIDKARDVEIEYKLLTAKRKAEAQSWDAAKLAPELGVASVLLDMSLKAADPVKTVKNLWAEVKQTGDRYKIRALAEVLPGLVAKTGNLDHQLAFNGVLTEARSKVVQIRNTPDIQKADQDTRAAFMNYQAAVREFRETAQLMDEADPVHPLAVGTYGMAFRRIRTFTDDHGTPTLRILEPDDPEIMRSY